MNGFFRKCWMVSACAAVLACTSTSTHAETWITLSGASWHFDRDMEFCESNPGVGLEYRRDDSNPDLSYVAGYFRNSYCKDTIYLGALWQPLKLGPLRAGVWATGASGYPSPVLVLPAITLRFERVSFNFVAAPTIGDLSGFVAVQAGIRFE